MIPAEARERLISYQWLRIAGIVLFSTVAWMIFREGATFVALGFGCVAIGALLNAIAIACNENRMPVLEHKNLRTIPDREARPTEEKPWEASARTFEHGQSGIADVLPRDSTWQVRGNQKDPQAMAFGQSVRCKPLACRFHFKPANSMYSIGDIVSHCGILLTVLQFFA